MIHRHSDTSKEQARAQMQEFLARMTAEGESVLSEDEFSYCTGEGRCDCWGTNEN